MGERRALDRAIESHADWLTSFGERLSASPLKIREG
jgi:hypothetical protein